MFKQSEFLESKIREFLIKKINFECGSKNRLKSIVGSTAICTWKWCKNEISIFTNSFLSRWKKSLKTFIEIILLLFIKIDVKLISTSTGYHYNNFKKMLKRLNNICKERYFNNF